ncbi:MAG: hypothetical protein U5K76_09170 [Woeseiaceae bacterium]|nr:hypothetical protein [Woeseiaceae bacterium]
MRNEALETHYIYDHVELLAVEHDEGAVVYDDPRHRPVVLRNLRAPVDSRDAGGPLAADRLLAVADGEAWRAARCTACKRDGKRLYGLY